MMSSYIQQDQQKTYDAQGKHKIHIAYSLEFLLNNKLWEDILRKGKKFTLEQTMKAQRGI